MKEPPIKRENHDKPTFAQKAKAALALVVSASFLAPPVTAAADTFPLKFGDSGKRVEELQRTLQIMDLYDYPELDGYFGSGTKRAVMHFQEMYGLHENGIADLETVSAMNQALDEYYPELHYLRDLSVNSRGEDVRDLQQVLRSMGYLGIQPDGIFTSTTASAVRTFQFDYGLVTDGVVSQRVMKKINGIASQFRPLKDVFSEEEDEIVESIPLTNALPEDSPFHADAVRMPWQDVNTLWPKGSCVKILDILSGNTFYLQRTGGSCHADAEPVGPADTQIMKACLGGGWSWVRRPVIVEFSFLSVAASLCGMPHGTKSVFQNDCEGHLCVYFSGSTTHLDGKQDPAHEKALARAAEYTYKNE